MLALRGSVMEKHSKQGLDCYRNLSPALLHRYLWPGTVKETPLQMEISLTKVNVLLQRENSCFSELLPGLLFLKLTSQPKTNNPKETYFGVAHSKSTKT